MLDEEDLPEEHLNSFEYYFYLTNGSVGTILNLIVLFIAFRHADTHDKPRQASFRVETVNLCFV